MHGNPANNLYGAIKLAACGELGVGVGEEERGSGEREALEGFPGHIEGLVDVIVSKFGGADSATLPEISSKTKDLKDRPRPKQERDQWLGTGYDPDAEDGAIFLGTGAISRKSVRDITHWMEDLYRWGPHAYGIIDNRAPNRKAKKSRRKLSHLSDGSSDMKKDLQASKAQNVPQRVPESAIIPSEEPLTKVDPMPLDSGEPTRANSTLDAKDSSSLASSDKDAGMSNKFVQYLTLGYGTHWSLGTSTPKQEDEHAEAAGVAGIHGKGKSENSAFPQDDSVGHYLIGLIDEIDHGPEKDHENKISESQSLDTPEDRDGRLLFRTLTVELQSTEGAQTETEIGKSLNRLVHEDNSPETSSDPVAAPKSSSASSADGKIKQVQVVVYACRPFIFTFLFEANAECVASPQLYYSIHNQLKPLVKHLLQSTRYRPVKPKIIATAGDTKLPIYDLLYDPKTLTITSTIPNIPDPYLVTPTNPKSADAQWSRMDALSTHAQLINTYVTVHSDDRARLELERTVKSNRGWWIVWTRVPELDPDVARHQRTTSTISNSSSDADHEAVSEDGSQSGDKSSRGETDGDTAAETKQRKSAHPFLEPHGRDKEIFLLRRASDNVDSRGGAGSLVSAVSGGRMEGWMGGTTRLAQGIGVDTRRYIEGLLNLDR